jgi:repressor LexA
MSEVLTPIERRIYNYLVEYLKRETFQPSIREIGTRFGIRSTKTVTEHLQSLQRKGYLDRTPSRSRALRILGLNLSPATVTVPLYKRPQPAVLDEDVEARYDLDLEFAGSADCYLVRASEDFPEYGILKGDMVLVDPCAHDNGSDLAVYDQGGVIGVCNPTTATFGNGSAAATIAPSQLLGCVRAVLRVFPKT